MKTQLNARASVLFLVFVVLGVYYPAIFSPINSVDDPGTINYLLNVESLDLRDIFTPGGAYYRPILLASFLADKYLWGLQESFMHLENVVFHLLNVLLLFAVARRGCLTCGVHSPVVPLTAALLFAVHPINAESVNWISGRTDPIACFFILLSIFLILKPAATPLARFSAALCLLAACLAKETAIFFLPAALVLPFYVDAEGERRNLRETALKNWSHIFIFSAAGAGFFLFRALAFHTGDVGVARVLTQVGSAQSGGGASLRISLKAVGFYFKKLLLPFPLNFGINHVSDLYLPVGVLVCLVIAWLVTRRTLAAYFFICAACLACSALMVSLLNMTWTPLAERYMYIPCAFFVMGAVFSIQSWQCPDRIQRFLPAAAAIILVVAVYGTASRTLLWQDNLALFQDTLKKSPGFVPAQNELAVALSARGEIGKAAATIDSMQLSRSLINYQYGLMTKSSALLLKGDTEGADSLLQQALKEPGKHEAVICRRLLTVYQMKVDKGTATCAQLYPDSIRLLSRLYELTGDPFYLYRRGLMHMAQKERRLARESFKCAAALAPASSAYRVPSLKLSQKMTD